MLKLEYQNDLNHNEMQQKTRREQQILADLDVHRAERDAWSQYFHTTIQRTVATIRGMETYEQQIGRLERYLEVLPARASWGNREEWKPRDALRMLKTQLQDHRRLWEELQREERNIREQLEGTDEDVAHCQDHLNIARRERREAERKMPEMVRQIVTIRNELNRMRRTGWIRDPTEEGTHPHPGPPSPSPVNDQQCIEKLRKITADKEWDCCESIDKIREVIRLAKEETHINWNHMGRLIGVAPKTARNWWERCVKTQSYTINKMINNVPNVLVYSMLMENVILI